MRFAESNQQSLAILAASLLILVNTLLHAHVYGNRNYREDEINTIHAAETLTPRQIVLWLASDVHPPGWRLAAAAWIDLFGTSEAVVRWSSKLINLLSFALVFQLGKHLIDRRAALYGVALLGLYGFASNSMYELRPYALLIALVTALHLVYLRWLRRPSGKLMVAYVFLGVAAMYTHFYAFTVFAAHALFMLVFRRLDRRFVYHTFAMWFFVALSFTPMLLPVMQTVLGPFSSGYYAVDLPTLVQTIIFNPAIILDILLVESLIYLLSFRRLSTRQYALRWYPRSRLVYPLFLLLATFAIALLVNSFWSVLNARGFTTVVMLIALMMATGLSLLPTKAGVVLLVLLYAHAPANLAFQPANAPYREIVQKMLPTYQTDSVVVTEFGWAWRWLLPAAYYLMDFTPDQMTKDQQFHLVEPRDSAHPPTYPDELVNIFNSFEPASFANQLPAHQQLWHLTEGGGNDLGAEFGDWLNQNYALVQTQSWAESYVTSYTLSEYARAPSHQGPMLLAGDELRLYTWQLGGSVNAAACESISVESWWQLSAEVDRSYTLSIILAEVDADVQIAIQNSIPAQVFTTEWQADKFYRDQTALQIPCAIEGGRYNLLLAAKETLSGAILPLRYPDGNAIGNEFYLTTLQISAG